MTRSAAVFRRDYDANLRTLHTARHDVIEWFAGIGADEATEERAALIVSELCSNAIQNSTDSPYNLQVARVDDSHVEITVRNHPNERLPPARENWRPREELSLRELSLRGRGLAIVDSLSEDVTIEHLGDELTVTARIEISFAAT